VLVSDLTCGALISQCTTGVQPHPTQSLTGPGEAVAPPPQSLTGPGEAVAPPPQSLTGPGEGVAPPPSPPPESNWAGEANYARQPPNTQTPTCHQY